MTSGALSSNRLTTGWSPVPTRTTTLRAVLGRGPTEGQLHPRVRRPRRTRRTTVSAPSRTLGPAEATAGARRPAPRQVYGITGSEQRCLRAIPTTSRRATTPHQGVRTPLRTPPQSRSQAVPLDAAQSGAVDWIARRPAALTRHTPMITWTLFGHLMTPEQHQTTADIERA
jgi:hypothetical protein